MNYTYRIGFWSANLTAVFAAAFLGMGIFGSSYTEAIKYPYVLTAIRPIDYVVWNPACFLSMVVVVLLVCVYRQGAADKKIFSQIALSFAMIYAGLTVSDFFLQWTVVLPSIAASETAELSLLSIYNPHGIPIAIECLGYLLLNSALLFLAPLFGGRNRLERSLRWLLVAGFVLVIGAFCISSLTGNPIVVFEVVAVTINVLMLVAAGASMSLFFKRAFRASRNE